MVMVCDVTSSHVYADASRNNVTTVTIFSVVRSCLQRPSLHRSHKLTESLLYFIFHRTDDGGHQNIYCLYLTSFVSAIVL